LQAEDSGEECHYPVARYEDNAIVIEAYHDPQLQPVVVMKRLESWYLADMPILFFSYFVVKSVNIVLHITLFLVITEVIGI